MSGARLSGTGLGPFYAVRRLVAADEPALRALRAEVLAHLNDPDHYRIEGESASGDFVADHLGDKGMFLGVFRDDELAGYGALTLPGPGDSNRGRDLPLPEGVLWAVAHLGSAMIAPAHRGRGLHHRLVVCRQNMARALGRHHLFTTVSLSNHVSWGHMLDHGFCIRRVLTVGPGLQRYLLYCDLQTPARYRLDSVRTCPVADQESAKACLARGLWGVGRSHTDQGWHIMFAEPVEPGAP